MIYNIDFLIAAFIFLLLILYHFMSQRKLEADLNNQFLAFVLLGIMDIAFDIFCTMLITYQYPGITWLTKASLTILYLLQVSVPYVLLMYTKSLREATPRTIWNIWSVIPGIMIGLILINIWRGCFFYFDEAGTYIRGPLYMYMYYYALLYVSIVAVESILYYKELGKRKFRVIWEFLIVACSCVIIQAVSHDLLVTGFGIALGITIMFLTLNNPYEYSDNLTGLLDDQYFKKWVHHQLMRETPFHLVGIDMYRMKQINKVMGNSYGDAVLAETAQGLEQIGGAQYTYRVSGNRFIIATSSLVEYERVRDSVREFFRDGFQIDGEKASVSAITSGILHGEEFRDSDDLLGYIEYLVSLVPEIEEAALVQSNEETLAGYRRTKEVERYLAEAIEKDLFEVYYQPVYSIEKDGYVTLEALSRLRHPTLGQISPAVFIDIAERNGQILEIGYLQFRRICRFIKANEDIMERIDNVKVNMSPAELLKRNYSKMIIKTIKEFGLQYRYFQFEITETVATEYSEQLYRTIHDFQKVGIQLCLDDFGSGYANLDTVLRIPFFAIKLDRSLLHGVGTEKRSALFYQSIVTLFSSMGYAVVAEGVETKAEKELLQQWGVDMIQGFYFSRPVPEDKIIQIV